MNCVSRSGVWTANIILPGTKERQSLTLLNFEYDNNDHFCISASIVWTSGCIAKIVVTRLVGVDSQIKGDRVEGDKDKTIEGT